MVNFICQHGMLYILVAFAAFALVAAAVAILVLTRGGDGPGSPGRRNPKLDPDPAGTPSEAYKGWKWVEGLEKKSSRDYPKEDMYVSWNPFAAPGQRVVDGGIMSPLGDLPTVNPPSSKYGDPYYMEPLWQQGGTEANDYYKKHCTHLVTSRGRLHYKGPNVFCDGGSCFAEKGGYEWRFKGPTDRRGNMTDGMGGIYGQPGRHDMTANTIMTTLMKGIELPPWMRRGPLSKNALAVFKQHCKPGAKPAPNCRSPDEVPYAGPKELAPVLGRVCGQ